MCFMCVWLMNYLNAGTFRGHWVALKEKILRNKNLIILILFCLTVTYFAETFILYPVNPVCVCTDTGQTWDILETLTDLKLNDPKHTAHSHMITNTYLISSRSGIWTISSDVLDLFSNIKPCLFVCINMSLLIYYEDPPSVSL